MPRYTVVPSDPQLAPIVVQATDPGSTIYAVERLECKEADIFENHAYRFSLRVDANGLWCIFQREELLDPKVVSLAG
jgi:hypothetical protein